MLINLKGVWWGCKHAIIAMRNNPIDPQKGLNKGGSIINTASFVALMGAATPQLACPFFPSLSQLASHNWCHRRYRFQRWCVGHVTRVSHGPRQRRDQGQRTLPVSPIIRFKLSLSHIFSFRLSEAHLKHVGSKTYHLVVHAYACYDSFSALLMDFLDTPEKRDRRLVHLPMGRFGEPVELARAALFREFRLK